MFAPLNGTAAGNDLTYLLLYANDSTSGLFVLCMVISFFLVVFISSLVLQQKTSGRIRADTSLLAASFVTIGFAAILEQKSGLLNPLYFVVLIGIAILAMIWIALSTD